MNKFKKALNTIANTLTYYTVRKDVDLLPSDNEMYGAMATLRELVEKETATEPDVEGDEYYKGKVVYDTWICPRCGARYEIDYDDYEYCPKCGQHIDLDILERENDDSDDKGDF